MSDMKKTPSTPSKSSCNNYENISSSVKSRPAQQPPLLATNLNVYKNAMHTPLKDEKSDQVRMEFLQQQQAIAQLKKQHLRLEQQQQQQQLNMKTTTTLGGGLNLMPKNNNNNKNDDLINCILDMKPPATNSNYMNVSAIATTPTPTTAAVTPTRQSLDYQNQFFVDQQKQQQQQRLDTRKVMTSSLSSHGVVNSGGSVPRPPSRQVS
jgi:hypothetical protein